MFQSFQFNLLPAQAFDKPFYNLLNSQGVDINSIPDKPIPFQCFLFAETHEQQYHEVWYMNNAPDVDYLRFAKTNNVLAIEAITYWFKIDSPCPVELIVNVLLILLDQPRLKTEYEPRHSIWHLYCYIDQMQQSNAFQPINQLYCVESLQSWIHSNNANVITCDPVANVLKWLLKSECYEWKKEFLHLWIKQNPNNKLPLRMDYMAFDDSWDVKEQLIALSLAKSVNQSQLFAIVRLLDDTVLDDQNQLNILYTLINSVVPCPHFNGMELIQYFVSLLQAGLNAMEDVASGHSFLNWISILVYSGTKWHILKSEHLDMLNQLIILAWQQSQDLLTKIRLLSFPLGKLTTNYIPDMHTFYLNYDTVLGYALLSSCLLQHLHLELTVDEEIYLKTKLLDMQLRPCIDDYNEILAQIDHHTELVKVTRQKVMTIGIIDKVVVAQWIEK